jgi:hypothetical protein
VECLLFLVVFIVMSIQGNCEGVEPQRNHGGKPGIPGMLGIGGSVTG